MLTLSNKVMFMNILRLLAIEIDDLKADAMKMSKFMCNIIYIYNRTDNKLI